MKLIVFIEQKLTTVSLESKSEWSLGRMDSTIMLNSNIAGRHHGILRKENNRWVYIDGGSGNGTYYNAEKMAAQGQVYVKEGDILRIDNRAMNMPQGVILLFVPEETNDDWKVIDLDSKDRTYIGRSQQNCDIYLPNRQVSRQHACVQQMNGQYYVNDCESQLGTAVNDYGIKEAVMLHEGDVISIAENPIYFSGHYLFYNQIEFSPDQPLVSSVTFRDPVEVSQPSLGFSKEDAPVTRREPKEFTQSSLGFNKEEAPVQSYQPVQQTPLYGASQRPPYRGVPLKTDRNLLMYLLLTFLTCGIYPFFFFYELAKDINIACEGDGEKTPGLLAFLLLSFCTCGIYAYYWYYKIADRMYKNAPRYGFEFEESGGNVLAWFILGAFLCGSGIYIGMYIILTNANKICKAYNRGQ